ncbi:MAG: alpha/beta hydrolase-fold protein [Gaiellaceae bacterium]
MRAFAYSLVALTIGALVVTSGAHTRSEGPLKVERAIYSPAVEGRLRLAVYLPAGYASSEKRYPVVYFLHGLPAAATSFRGADFLARALAASGRRAIIVAPQGARDHDSDPEYLDWGPGRNWETAITRDIVGYVDSHLRTIPTRRGRAIVGLSAGGYGAVLLALHHLPAFSVVESWSGYFHPTDPAGDHALDLGSPRANAQASAHAFVKTLRHAFVKSPTFFAFYVGRGDERFRDENQLFHRELTEAGVPHLFRVYPGGHQQSVWTAHARAWLTVAVDHLARPMP